MRRGRDKLSTAIELHTLALFKDDIRALPAAHRHFLINSSLALNDINAFCKMLILYGDAGSKNQTVLGAGLMHYFVLTRILASRLVEFIKLVGDYAIKCQRSKKPVPADAAAAAACEMFLAEATGAPAYGKWRELRSAVINHYVLKDEAIERNIGRWEDGHRFNIVIHEGGGNTFFPIGEDVGFLAALGDYDTDAEAAAAVEELMDWCISTSRAAQAFQAERVVLMLEELLPDLGHETETAYVEEKFIIREGARPPGLFFLREKAAKRRRR